MSRISFSQVRTSTLSSSNQTLSSLQRTQRALAQLQQQLSTGRTLERPSDEPARVSSVLHLEAQISARDQHERNLQHARGVLNNADSALGDATTILREALSIALSQVGIGSSAETRESQATVIDAQLKALIDIGNRQYQGISLFGGSLSAERNGQVLVEFLGGVRYLGAREDLVAAVGGGGPLTVNTNGDDAFAALSSRVQSMVDIDPQASPQTRIVDVTGAQGVPVRLGSISVSVNGTEALVELGTAETLEDVVDRVQAAIDAIDPAAGTIAIAGQGFELTAAGAITITDIGHGQTAGDLGLNLSATGGVVSGAALDPHLTSRTTPAEFGVAIDLASGLSITQGAATKIADFSSAQTVEDMINVIDQLDLGLRLEVNEQRNGFNLISEVSGIELSIGENGGTTASDLGLRTFGNQTALADLRLGLGVEPVLDEDDFAIELHDGRTFSVNLDGIATVGEALDAIEAAATAAGLAVGAPGDAGTDFNVGLRPMGNGFRFEDATAGAGDFQVVQLGTSLVATQLGIYTNAGADAVLDGQDVAKVRAESIFTHMIDFRDALRNDDSFGIAVASDAIDVDIETVARIQADVGTRAQRVDRQEERSQQLKNSERTLLSELQDTELTEAITRFLQLQQQLEASLRVGGSSLQMSLMEFLR
ncbi:MAG: hypothetical protein CMJ18_25775 [Phycisphaeraceae bacterium]|nr:hypothetical protein [Phycisphaeraceae bacterium]